MNGEQPGTQKPNSEHRRSRLAIAARWAGKAAVPVVIAAASAAYALTGHGHAETPPTPPRIPNSFIPSGSSEVSEHNFLNPKTGVEWGLEEISLNSNPQDTADMVFEYNQVTGEWQKVVGPGTAFGPMEGAPEQITKAVVEPGLPAVAVPPVAGQHN